MATAQDGGNQGGAPGAMRWVRRHARVVSLACGAWLTAYGGHHEADEIDVVSFLGYAWLFLAGPPWSALVIDPVTTADNEHVGEPWRTLLATAPAILNLVLHATFRMWQLTRRAPR